MRKTPKKITTQILLRIITARIITNLSRRIKDLKKKKRKKLNLSGKILKTIYLSVNSACVSSIDDY